MKVEDKRLRNLVDLSSGVVFNHRNTFYLKTDRWFDDSLEFITCVELDTGRVIGVEKNTKVNVVEAKVVVGVR